MCIFARYSNNYEVKGGNMTKEIYKIVQDILLFENYEERENYLNDILFKDLISIILILLDYIEVCHAENNVLQIRYESLEKEVYPLDYPT